MFLTEFVWGFPPKEIYLENYLHLLGELAPPVALSRKAGSDVLQTNMTRREFLRRFTKWKKTDVSLGGLTHIPTLEVMKRHVPLLDPSLGSASLAVR